LQLERHEVSISTSVGIALNDPPTTDANNLIRNADIALYRAKESGASQYVVFDESMARRVIARLELENDLRQGFERDEFRIEFLPELNLENGKLAALEVLTRWKHPARGDIDPDEFMPVAAETGLIVQLGRWAFTQACAHVRGWQMRHPAARQLTIAVNLSAREFQQPDLVEFIISTLDRYSIAPHMVRIEIDESTMAAGPEEALGKLRALRDYGICLAIDNFGSGFSSLSYLTQLSFDMLKVDRQFISGDGGVVSNLSIVRAVTSLAHALGMIVTAEGIETREHLARVRAAGCDCGQGYLFSRSLDAASVEAIFLSSNGA
jgi:EAL domain-containing protein (putative c-di-GMP-specific phosphodiesterase class I)